MKIAKQLFALSLLALCFGFVGCAAESAPDAAADTEPAATETDAGEAAEGEGGSDTQ